MKFNLILFSFLIYSAFAGAQANVYDVKEYMSLTDEVHFIRVFIDTDYGYWEDDEMAAYDRKLTTSLDWLTDQAFANNADVFFNLSTFENLDDLVDLPVDGFRQTRGIRDKVINELGYDHVNDLLDSYNFDMDNHKLKMLVFVKSNNRSHARNYWSVKGLDIAVVYCNSTMGMATNSAVISHEILHLFGAWDLYKGERQTAEKAAELMEKYPNSVMINTWRHNPKLEVDELTAWRVGWGSFQQEYMDYKPARNNLKPSKGNTDIKFKLGGKKKKDGDG